MASVTDNTEYTRNITTGYVYSYYTVTSTTVSNTSHDLNNYSEISWPNIDHYGNSDVWTPPFFAPKIDIKRDRPNKPLVLNRCRHIAPMHFRHVRTQQRKV